MVARLAVYSKQQLPEKLADYVLNIQDKVLGKKDRFNVAISGGSLAKTMAAGLIGNSRAKLAKWNVWLADERIVKNEHADSNFGVFKQDFLSQLPEDQQPTCFPLNDKLPEGSPSSLYAKDYQDRLVKELGDKPSLDFIFLGCGPDGHTCSLFPGHKLLEDRSDWVASLDDSPKPPPSRITLTKPSLAIADYMVMVATGEGKREAIEGIFVKRDPALPSFQVNELAKNELVWFVDPAAVGDINVEEINAKI